MSHSPRQGALLDSSSTPVSLAHGWCNVVCLDLGGLGAMMLTTISEIGAVSHVTLGVIIISFDSWTWFSIPTKTHLMYPFLGNLWHWFEIGFRVHLGLLLSLGYAIDGLENILLHHPSILLFGDSFPDTWYLQSMDQVQLIRTATYNVC